MTLSIPGDGHPTALANRLRASILKNYLERNMPEVVRDHALVESSPSFNGNFGETAISSNKRLQIRLRRQASGHFENRR